MEEIFTSERPNLGQLIPLKRVFKTLPCKDKFLRKMFLTPSAKMNYHKKSFLFYIFQQATMFGFIACFPFNQLKGRIWDSNFRTFIHIFELKLVIGVDIHEWICEVPKLVSSKNFCVWCKAKFSSRKFA